MKYKSIQIVFAFSLLLFNLSISEETKLKLVTVKKFNSYEEYEKWDSTNKLLKKQEGPSYIKIEENTIKFFDENGNLVKKRNLCSYERQEIPEIIKKLQNDKNYSFYFEEAKIIKNDILLLTKTTIYYDNKIVTYEIYDKKGKIIGEILENITLYLSPNAEYFVGVYNYGPFYATGEIGFFNINGELIKKEEVFDHDVANWEIIFSEDSEYGVCVFVGKDYYTGLIVFDKSGKIITKIIKKNWTVFSYIQNNKGENNLIKWLSDNKKFIVVSNLGIECYTKEGELVWNISLDNVRFGRKYFVVNDNTTLLVVFYKKENEMVGTIIDIFTGQLVKTFTLNIVPVDIDIFEIIYKSALEGKKLDLKFDSLNVKFVNDYIIINCNKLSKGLEEKSVKGVYLLDRKGNLVWYKEIQFNENLYGDFDKQKNFFILIEGKQVSLLKIKK